MEAVITQSAEPAVVTEPVAPTAAIAPTESTWAAKAVRGVLRAYQLLISPLLGPACRFEPSCSRYTAQAVTKYGAIKGVYLGAHRVCRCHPLNPGGFDPVP
jgi:putative membrane protein insertion efficiency factor